MNTFNTQFTNTNQLLEFIHTHQLNTKKEILIQIFSPIIDKKYIMEITKFIKKALPTAHIIGTTTGGGILNGEMISDTVLISFSTFSSTIIQSALCNLDTTCDINKNINSLILENTKALIIFSDGLKSNAEELLKSLTLINPNITIAGGRAADTQNFSTTLVFNHTSITENGFVVVSLSGDDLIVNNDYILNWNQIGKEMTITKSNKNIVFEVDNIPIKELYQKYLGPVVSDNLPASGTEFPLVTKRNGMEVARSVIALEEDNSFLFAGNLHEGEKVKFSYGNINDIKTSVYEKNVKLVKLPIESIFIYSCVGRKTLIGKELEAEFKMLHSLAPTAGFFTFGEYFHSSNINELLNITTTFLTLSETPKVKKKKIYAIQDYTHNRVLKALTHLSHITAKEIEFKNKELLRLNDMISKSVLYSTSDLDGNIITISKTYLDFLHLEEKDIIGKNHSIFRHPDTPDSFYDDMWKALEKNQRFIGEFKNIRANGHEYWLKIVIDSMYNEDGVKIGYSSYKENITEKKALEYSSRHDALTGLYNKRAFTSKIDTKLKTLKRYKEGFSFALFDIDNFKVVNDTYGHKVGDDVLIKLGKCLTQNIREDDFLARWGGEEFVIIANHTNINDLVLLIQKFQNELQKTLFSPVHSLTLSFGLTVTQDNDTKESLLQRADKALYKAKNNGKNRYEII